MIVISLLAVLEISLMAEGYGDGNDGQKFENCQKWSKDLQMTGKWLASMICKFDMQLWFANDF